VDEEVVDGLIVRFNVAVESHPIALVVTYVYAPDEVYAVPFHIYESQAVAELVDVVDGLIVKFRVAVESHPLELVVL
jgi:hypothetical protein